MAKIKMTYPKFGWFDGAYEFNISEFHPNSADPTHGGVSIIFDYQNLTGKTIKYINFGFTAYNGVGDQIGEIVANRDTGPINTNQIKSGLVFHNAWYNRSIKSVKLASEGNVIGIKIWYMDGTEEQLSTDDVELASSLTRTSSSTTSSSGGCYVATAVYGSYDCPQVWTLRRYRDNCLAETWYGRAFIRLYYAISPTLVKLFGDSKIFKNFWKKPLDKMVDNLLKNGYKDTPYNDKSGEK